MEPMIKLKVKEVIEQGELKIIRVEPVKWRLQLYENINPPEFTRHIITSLSKHGRDSKEECDRMCKILCKAYMDDYSSCKTQNLPAISTQLICIYLLLQLTTKTFSENTVVLKSSLRCSEPIKTHRLQKHLFMC